MRHDDLPREAPALPVDDPLRPQLGHRPLRSGRVLVGGEQGAVELEAAVETARDARLLDAHSRDPGRARERADDDGERDALQLTEPVTGADHQRQGHERRTEPAAHGPGVDGLPRGSRQRAHLPRTLPVARSTPLVLSAPSAGWRAGSGTSGSASRRESGTRSSGVELAISSTPPRAPA